MKCLLRIVLFVPLATIVGNTFASVENLVRDQGYPFEQHSVVTEDGYILTLHRIPHGKSQSKKIGRPVILQHAILCSSAVWVLSRPDKALGFILADQGYDVWMANSRGNTYSKKHQNLSVNSAEYWDFSFHELGYYDLPACIDYILQQTGYPSLHYVGHSQGSTVFFVLASTRPEYNQKINHMSALAPIVFLEDLVGIAQGLIFMSPAIEFFLQLSGTKEILPDTSFVHGLAEACKPDSYIGDICNNIVFMSIGFDAQQWNMTLASAVYTYIPAGCSVKQLLHFFQIVTNGRFRHYDYTYEKNLELYNLYEPPEYDLSKISIPVTLFYGKNDWLSREQNVKKLHAMLPNSEMVLVTFPHFNHLDFLWANDVVKLLYEDLLKVMAKH